MADNRQANGLREKMQAFVLDPDLERLEASLAQFNLFEILGIQRDELRHSAFLAWLLNPRGSHRLGDYFLRHFLSLAVAEGTKRGIKTITPFHVDRWGLTDIEVYTEVAAEGSRIDILVVGESDGFVSLIENKIGSGEGVGQLNKYLAFIEHSYELTSLPIFLTPDGIEPQDNEDAESYVPLGYKEVVDLIDQTIKSRGTTIGDSVRSLLEQYSHTLRRHVVNTADNIDGLARAIYQRHTEAIDYIAKMKRGYTAQLLDLVDDAIVTGFPSMFTKGKHRSDIHRFSINTLAGIPELNAGTDGDYLNKIFIAEFKYSNNKPMVLHLMIGPGPDGTRKRLYNLQVSNVRLTNRKAMAKKWHTKYMRTILNMRDCSSFDPENTTPLNEAIQEAIRKFIEEDYLPIVNAIREEFGHQPISSN